MKSDLKRIASLSYRRFDHGFLGFLTCRSIIRFAYYVHI